MQEQTSATMFDPDPLSNLYRARDYVSRRAYSHDPAGRTLPGGDDKHVLLPGEEMVLADLEGPGIIRHIWFTLSREIPEVLTDPVLRIYWDDETTPSVEAPFGAFFGLGLGKYYSFQSWPFACGNRRGYNCFLPMPFRHRARLVFTNGGRQPLRRLFYYIDWQQVPTLPDDALYFHAQYRQEKPATIGRNYTIVEAEGRGHFVGLFMYVRSNAATWWGEGGDVFFIDDRKQWAIHGTGAEDYFCHGWGMEEQPFGHRFGVPYWGTHGQAGGESAIYRFHLEEAITFRQYFRMEIHHGNDNDLADDYASVAYWYQTEPHSIFPLLPPETDRGPTIPDPPRSSG